ncbi:tRNA1(Val) (adenine(37)-N6)-methyltransferase [Fructilactobacillus myrtifloralis]|uniref:tRNA1(Val) (Adenine(37)-N6)-methyltransferase n=1 Tax=Fructilactobacillus myrtifloralis TaxID=2940301 RepID=A0ABY5BP18_9LACO|nr:tRNA1(Val) (adenine(37)-N6)-methyltransferase [Fructilactobacillus myrtifloralis]USS85439.1 tRNA1(Val) (adenine(37)-N6)-methyltransferase [Fructilactobacillus myrtifloralis]
MKHVELQPGERIDQLYQNHIQIIQSDEVFSFSLDAVLLANFAQVKQSAKTQIVDLCAGNGAVGLFLSPKTRGQITEIEIQARLCDMARRSVQLNQLENQVHVQHADLNQSLQFFAKETVDTVTVNPPYFPVQATSRKNPNEYLAIARHELKTNLGEVVSTASELLKPGGKLFMVHRPDRLLEILTTLKSQRLAPKQLQFVYPRANRDANMVLIAARKDGQVAGLKVQPPLIVYDQDHYTPAVRKLLYGN